MKKFSLLTITVLVAACSSNTPPKSYTIVKEDIQLNDEQKIELVLERPYKDRNDVSEKFRVVKPSHTAKVTGLKVLGFLTGQRTTGFSKYDLVGDVVEQQNIYIHYVIPNLKELIQKNVKLAKETKYKRITVYPTEFKLVYDELVGNDNYTLHYGFETKTDYKEKKENGEIIAGDNIFQCNEKSESKYFPEWEKEKYALANFSARKMTDKCLSNMSDFFSKTK